jgi:hypothetical protein
MRVGNIGGKIALLCTLFAAVFVASPGSAFTLDWETIGWDPNDTSGVQVFSNLEASNIDLTVSYTTTMFFNDANRRRPNRFVEAFPLLACCGLASFWA